MVPHLVRWAEEYGGDGFVVLDIDNGRIDSREKLAHHVEEFEIPYPVAWDEGAKTCDAYGVTGYPAAYLIGRDGKVIWEGIPFPPEAMERKILEALGRRSTKSGS